MLFPLSLHTMDVWLNRWTQKKNYERLQKALDSVMSIREMTQVQEGDGRGRRTFCFLVHMTSSLMFHCDCIKFNIAQFSVYFGLWCSSCMGGVFVYLSGSCRLVFLCLCTSSLFFPLWLDWLHLYYVLKESWVSRSFDYVKKKRRKSVETRNELQTTHGCVFFFLFFSQGSYLEIKKQMDKLDPLAHPLLQWWVDGSGSENAGLLLRWMLTGIEVIPESKIRQCSFAESK